LLKNRIVIWTATAGLAVLLASASFVAGYIAHKRLLISPRLRAAVGHRLAGVPLQGRFRPFRPPGEIAGPPHEAMIQQLNAIGYVQGRVPAPATEGVTVFDRERSFRGLNLYASAHASVACLMDMEGEILHEWRYEFSRVWPDFEPGRLTSMPGTTYWRRVHLYENGDLLAIHEGIGVLKLDKSSKLLWSNQCNAHHDLDVTDDGTIFVLTRKAHVVPRWYESLPILEDFVTMLSPDGQVVRDISVLECFENSEYAPVLRNMPEYGDVFHTNTLAVLDGRHEERSSVFRRGNVLVSVRELDIVAIIDLEQRAVVWATTGMWSRQHEPILLDNGNMLLFDNLGRPERSRVLEFDPFTHEIVWSYGSDDGEPLYSRECGANSRLPNGNTLIIESENGRALEVTHDKAIVWEYISPHRAGKDRELIATLMDLVRLPPDSAGAWLPES